MKRTKKARVVGKTTTATGRTHTVYRGSNGGIYTVAKSGKRVYKRRSKENF